eukprot:TRINITY_DN5006_c0_g1_i1.p2 TRINITY_DN5006_c0_g1~~TRINITY_DN5006_c0_g1_i1.p2  ORF type:complete len:199 (-),score=38.12 TRINITY_DN5006_c0_g1_i1:53-649(-)
MKRCKCRVAGSNTGKKIVLKTNQKNFHVVNIVIRLISEIRTRKEGMNVGKDLVGVITHVLMLANENPKIAEEIISLRVSVFLILSYFIDFCEMPFCVNIPLIQKLTLQFLHELQAKEHLISAIEDKQLKKITITTTFICSDIILEGLFAPKSEAENVEQIEELQRDLLAELRKFWHKHVLPSEKKAVEELQVKNTVIK